MPPLANPARAVLREARRRAVAYQRYRGLGRYALKYEAYAMTPATGAIIWMRSQNAEPGDLDLHSRARISSTRTRARPAAE
jgi:hypothetical protein